MTKQPDIEQLDKIISDICSDGANCQPTKLCEDCVIDKQRLLDWHDRIVNEAVVRARVDELRNFIPQSDIAGERYLWERIDELEAELTTRKDKAE